MSATPPASPPLSRTSAPTAPTTTTNGLDRNVIVNPSGFTTETARVHAATERTPLLSLQSRGADPSTSTTYLSPLSLAFLLQGLGMLYPWNALISNPHFFATYLFAGSRWESAFENWFAFAYLLANACTTAATLKPVSAAWDRNRTLFAFAANASVFVWLVVVASTISDASSGPVGAAADRWFALTLIAVVVSGIGTAVVQSHLFAVAAKASSKGGGSGMHTTMMVVGQAVSGVAVCLLQLYLTSSATTDRTSATVYFGTSVAVLVACLLMYLPMSRAIFAPTPIPGDPTPITISPASSLPVSEADTEELLFGQPLLPASSLALQPNLVSIAWRIMPYLASLFLNFTITLSLFPALSALIATDPTDLMSQPAFTALLFLAFNVGDTLGRSLPLAPLAPTWVLGLTLARSLFVPMFLVGFPLTVPSNPWIPHLGGSSPPSKWVALAVMVAMATSSGWIAKVCLAEAPGWATATRRSDGYDAANEADDDIGVAETRGLVGRMMTLSMLVGLTAGSACGFLVVGAATAGS